MLSWLDRFMARFALPDDSAERARNEHLRAPAREEVFSILVSFAFDPAARSQALAAALASIDRGALSDAAYARRLLRALAESFARTDAPVADTIAPAQIALNLLPQLRMALLSEPAGAVVPFTLIEGILAMRTGQFPLAFERLARAEREAAAGLSEHWTEDLLPAGTNDLIALAAGLAAATLAQLENPDLRLWGKTMLAIPGDGQAVRDPDALLLAAGDLVLRLHRASTLVSRPEPEEREAILESADAHYRYLFGELHPQAAECRRVLANLFPA